MPLYKLKSSHLKAEVGQSVKVKFSVVKDSYWGDISGHTLKKDGSENITTPHTVEFDRIVFQKLSVEDSGEYTISCRNGAGEGSASFTLDVTPTKGNSLFSMGCT